MERGTIFFYAMTSAFVCLLCAYANTIGWRIIDFDGVSSHKPTGAGFYHK